VSTDNPVVTGKDYAAERSHFLAGIDNQIVKDTVSELDELPYHLPEMFHDVSGTSGAKQARARVRIIKALEPLLKKMLFDGEEVRFVTKGVYSSLREKYALGWISAMINRTLFVFTNYRLIMVNTDRKDHPLHWKWHISYDQILKFKTRALSSAIVFQLKDRKTLLFSSVPRYDRKPLGKLVEGIMRRSGQEEFHFPHYSCKDNLCTNCFLPVPPKTYRCESCGEEFIRPLKSAFLSLCLPSLGDFYTGRPLVGIFGVLTYCLSWFMFLTTLAAGKAETLVIFWLAIIPFIHIMSSLTTRQVASKGLVSVRNAWGKRAGAADPPAQSP